MKISKESDKSVVFTRRAVVVGAFQTGILLTLGARLAWLQIAEGQRYKTLSEQNRINLKMLIPSRGQIVDRFGVPLALNTQDFRIMLVPEQAQHVERSFRTLQRYIDIDEHTIQSVLKQAKRTAKFVPLEVKDGLTWEEVSKIEVNLPDLPGLSIDEGEVRNYPYGDATSHLIGYVGAVNKNEMDAEDNPILRQPGFKIGKTGIEKQYDEQMRGRAGASEVEVNVVGREIRELKRKQSTAGERLTLSIDAELQRFVQARLAQEKSASAVIMDVHTGALYALGSHPAFDPNVFSRGISAALWQELLADPTFPLTNKAIGGQYPPASTFKMVVAMAGLKAGLITPSRSVFCPGFYNFGKGRFHCWRKEGHGHVDVVDAIVKSCDTFFYHLSTEIGIEKIAEMARQFGLGKKFTFELSEQKGGLVPDPAWKKRTQKESWQPGDTIISSIGQGFFLATPLQLAVMTARFVNGGYAVEPWLVEHVGDAPRHNMVWPKMDLDPQHLQIIRKGMEDVVNLQGGTAYGSRITEPGQGMGGKTGTAQVQRITMAQRKAGIKNEDLSWRQRHHALFVGYAPYDNPRYACAVVVEHGIGGSRTAAPIARDLLLETQRRKPEMAAPRQDGAKIYGPVLALDQVTTPQESIDDE
jgi:penicillin-binding protein 2